MRIKINVTSYEAEVLDRKGERVYYVKGDHFELDADVKAIVKEITALGEELN